jgi:hypothetical protein
LPGAARAGGLDLGLGVGVVLAGLQRCGMEENGGLLPMVARG